MASILDHPAVREAALHLGVEQYQRLGEAGIIPENTELLRGVIVTKMTKSPERTWLVEMLGNWLRAAVPAGYHVRQEQPLTRALSVPEPDLAVVRGSVDDYRRAHPREAVLVIEVAVATLEVDLLKADDYAASGVPEYWLVAPGLGSVAVFTDPVGGQYRTRRDYGRHDTLVAVSLPDSPLELGRIFG